MSNTEFHSVESYVIVKRWMHYIIALVILTFNQSNSQDRFFAQEPHYLRSDNPSEML